MLISAQAIAELSKNGVVSLKELKNVNYYLYKLYIKNKEKFDELLLIKHNVCILNDVNVRLSPEYVRLYLLYHYGKDINLTELKKVDWQAYYNICINGGVEYFRNLGFNFTYNKKNKYIEQLKRMADKNGYLYPPKSDRHPKLYQALYFRARSQGMSYVEYLKSLGFKIKDRKEWIQKHADDGS
jgi:hypothetical protein